MSELEAAIRELGLERDDDDEGWWLPAEPGPIHVSDVAMAVREAMRLVENDERRSAAVAVATLRDALRNVERSLARHEDAENVGWVSPLRDWINRVALTYPPVGGGGG